ncbi:hypothetical protein KGF45_09400 [Clostridioides sp. ZZV14-6154]|nr:hypothetical protein [Clostridioides sp. ZZV14-6154]
MSTDVMDRKSLEILLKLDNSIKISNRLDIIDNKLDVTDYRLDTTQNDII